MPNALASTIFYARFFHRFSRIGFIRRVGRSPALDCDFRGQRWVVTGASGGIGAAVARGALASGARVSALARSPQRLSVLHDVPASAGRLEVLAVDLASVAETRAAAAQLAQAGRVDVLVNNVGVMLHAHSLTREGVETSFATNLLNHYVLTESLRAAGALAADGLVLSMGSGGMYGARLDLGKLEAQDPARHDGFVAYAQHKRAQAELTHYWNSLGSQAPQAVLMHPGWVDSEGVRSALPGFRAALGRWLRSADEGADTALWLAAHRPPRDLTEGIWLDRRRDPEHAFGFTRGGADAAALVDFLRGRIAAIDAA